MKKVKACIGKVRYIIECQVTSYMDGLEIYFFVNLTGCGAVSRDRWQFNCRQIMQELDFREGKTRLELVL